MDPWPVERDHEAGHGVLRTARVRSGDRLAVRIHLARIRRLLPRADQATPGSAPPEPPPAGGGSESSAGGGGESEQTAIAVALHVLETTLRLLHPIMPFVTEELWQRLPHEGETIMYAAWPLPDATLEDEALMQEMAHLLDVVRAVRNLRHSSEPRARRQPAEVNSARALLAEPVGRSYLATLAQLELNGKLGDDIPQAVVVVGQTTVRLGLQADGEAERKRLLAELQKKDAEIASLQGKLDDRGFTEKAPKPVVERDRTRLVQARAAADRLRALLGQMPELR